MSPVSMATRSFNSSRSATSAYFLAREKAKVVRQSKQEKLLQEIAGAVSSVREQISEYEQTKANLSIPRVTRNLAANERTHRSDTEEVASIS